MDECRRRRRGGDDGEHVALVHLVPAVNRRFPIPPNESRDWRTPPLRLELREALDPEAAPRERIGKALRSEDDALAASARESAAAIILMREMRTTKAAHVSVPLTQVSA